MRFLNNFVAVANWTHVAGCRRGGGSMIRITLCCIIKLSKWTMRQVEISVPIHASTVVPLCPYSVNLLPERGNCLTNWTEMSSMCNLRLPIGDLQFRPEALAQSGAWLHLAGDAFPASQMSSCRCYAAISAISDSRVMASDGTAETAVAQTNNQSGSASISR